MIIHKHKCVFVHVPKTGGFSVELALTSNHAITETDYDCFVGWDDKNRLWMQHMSMQQINDLYDGDLSEYFKFAFVRNPWARAVSDYSWMCRDLKVRGTFVDYLLHQHNFKDRLVANDNDRTKFWIGDHIILQYDFSFDENGNQLVDFIGRFENFQEDFNIVCDKIGIPRQELPHKHKTKHKHYTEYYNEETKQIVAEKYAKDIEYFGYEYGE